VKFLSALYLAWVLGSTAFAAWLASDAFFKFAIGQGPMRHPWFAAVLHVFIFGLLFFQGLLMHLRVTSSAIVGLGLLLLTGIMVAAVHFFM